MKTKIVAKDTFEDLVVKRLKKSPKELKEFEKYVAEEFNKNGDLSLLLENLKIIAKAKGNIKSLAEKSKVTRATIYNMLSRDSDPRVRGLFSTLTFLGAKIQLSF